jgi:hypothetical protein
MHPAPAYYLMQARQHDRLRAAAQQAAGRGSKNSPPPAPHQPARRAAAARWQLPLRPQAT